LPLFRNFLALPGRHPGGPRLTTQRCLIADPDRRIVIHHARGSGDVVATRIVSEGVLRLESPGIELTVGELCG
jgi:hypothetical protein